MVKRRCRVIFAAVCGYFCNGLWYFLQHCSFATKNSISLGRFRVKNATVRAGKSLCYGLGSETRLFGVGNATVWGYFCDCWRFVISCLR